MAEFAAVALIATAPVVLPVLPVAALLSAVIELFVLDRVVLGCLLVAPKGAVLLSGTAVLVILVTVLIQVSAAAR